MESETIVQLLREWRAGDEEAYARLIPLDYGELRRLARGQIRRERPGHSLQPTVLVHEAYLRLVKADVDWRNRTHFLSVAARVMRRILVEHARAKAADKRGGNVVHVTLSGPIPARDEKPIDILALDQALDRLRELDARQAEIVEMCSFGGLTYPENRGAGWNLGGDRGPQPAARARVASAGDVRRVIRTGLITASRLT